MSNSTRPMCEVCGLCPASVFDPSFAMWCAGCDMLGLGHIAVREKTSEYAEALGRMFDAATFFTPDYAAINRKWREQMGEPNDAEALADADKSYVWEDAKGVHWGWVSGNGWVAWSTSRVSPWGRAAVAPFAVAYKLSNAEFSPHISAASSDMTAGSPAEQMVPDILPDMVEQPAHYRQGPPCKGCGRTIECLDITEHMNFCLGNTVKYVWRCDLKRDAIEDLRKARTYLDREISRREAPNSSPTSKTKG